MGALNHRIANAGIMNACIRSRSTTGMGKGKDLAAQ